MPFRKRAFPVAGGLLKLNALRTLILPLFLLFFAVLLPNSAYADFVPPPAQNDPGWAAYSQCSSAIQHGIEYDATFDYTQFNYRCNPAGSDTWVEECPKTNPSASTCHLYYVPQGNWDGYLSGGTYASPRSVEASTGSTATSIITASSDTWASSCSAPTNSSVNRNNEHYAPICPNGQTCGTTERTCTAQGTQFTLVCNNDSATPQYQNQCMTRIDTGFGGAQYSTSAFADPTISGNPATTVTIYKDGNSVTAVDTNGQRNDRGGVVEDFLHGLGTAAAQVSLGLLGIILLFITEIINWVLTLVLAFVSWIFDISVTEFVIQMGKYVTSSSASGVRLAWTIVRDFANIAVIGGLVATAIGTIIGNDKYNVNKTLARLLLAALLVNFSYFFAGAIIDFSNFMATQAYQHLVNVDCSANGAPDTQNPQGGQNCGGPAAAVFGSLAIDRIPRIAGNAGQHLTAVTTNGAVSGINNSTTDVLTNQANGQSSGEQQGGGVAVIHEAALNLMETFFLVAITFVMLSAISLLVARFIALVFILVTSPIGIAASSVPILKNYADEWWKALWSQALFAPAYFFLLGIALTIYRGYTHISFVSQGTLGNVTGDSPLTELMGTMVSMIIGIGFLLVALSTAKQMSEQAKAFSNLYKQADKFLGGGARAYTGGLRYAGAVAQRALVGRGALWAAERQRGAAVRIQQWAKDSALGQAISAIPGVKAAARAADRAIQAQLDKTASQKWGVGADGKGGVQGFAALRDEKIKRKAELDAKREKLENTDKKDGRHAESELAKAERKLKADEKKNADEIKQLESLKNPNQDQKDRLAALRKKQEGIKKDRAEIADFKANLKAARKGKQPLRQAGTITDKNTGELIESTELDDLYEDRRKLQASGVWEGKEMEDLEAKIAKAEAFEKQKDKFEWGGADGEERRKAARYRRAIAEGGEQLRAYTDKNGNPQKGYNERARAAYLEGRNGSLDASRAARLKALERMRSADPSAFEKDDALMKEIGDLEADAYMSSAEEAAYTKAKADGTFGETIKEALKTPTAERQRDIASLKQQERDGTLDEVGRNRLAKLEAHETLLAASKKLTGAEKRERISYRDKTRALSEPEYQQLVKDRELKAAGKITDTKRLAKLADMETRLETAGAVDASGRLVSGLKDASGENLVVKGLSEDTQESVLAFASRQQGRIDGFSKRAVELDEDATAKTGKDVYKMQDLYGYKRELETGAIGLRDARGIRTNLTDNLGVAFLKEEYKKDRNRIIPYLVDLNDEDWAKLSQDHEIDEETLNKGWIARTRRWGDEFIRLQQDVIDGKVVKGSTEYNQRANDLFNQQVNYIPRKEFLSGLRQNAVIGTLHNHKTGEHMHVRLKDLNSNTESFGNLRETAWTTTSSTMFADAKDSNMFGRNLTAEIAKAKRSGAERIIVKDHAVSDMFDLDGDNFLLVKRGGKVQADATGRARKATAKIVTENGKALSTFSTDNPGTGTDVADLEREQRFAVLHQNSINGRGPFNAAVKKALEDANEDAIRAEIADKLGLKAEEAAGISKNDIESYIKINTKKALKEKVLKMSDAELDATPDAADQKLVFEIERENDAAGAARMRGWTPKEAGAAINDRSLLSTAVQKNATEEQIPVLLDGPDPAEKEKFIEGLLLSRSPAQLRAMSRNPAIQAVWIAPTKETLRKINIRRLAAGESVLTDVDTRD